LRPIRESIGREMRWRRTRFLPSAFELRAGDDIIASLEWPGIFSRSAIAATGDARLRFRRPAMFSLSVIVEDADTGTPVARYSPTPLRGTLRFENGRVFHIGRENLLGRLKAWREDGGELLSFPKRLAIGGGGLMEIEASAAAEPELGVLATFAFYVLTLRRRRAASSSGGR
jgi:hypothetical protein